MQSLNFHELDVEALERRLELVEAGSCECYYCISDYPNGCGSSPQPQDQDLVQAI